MNRTQIALSLVLADLLALTAYAVYRYGYLGFFDVALSSAVGIQVFTDLLIALGLALAWMWRDARRRGLSVAPYALLTLALGSVGLLAYLIRTSGDAPGPVLETGAARG